MRKSESIERILVNTRKIWRKWGFWKELCNFKYNVKAGKENEEKPLRKKLKNPLTSD